MTITNKGRRSISKILLILGHSDMHINDSDTHTKANLRSKEVIGAAIEVHRLLGPGLLESVYEECLCRELELRDVPFSRQVDLPVHYKGQELNKTFRLDVIVDEQVIVDLKAIQKLQPIDEAQLLTYLKLTGVWLGLIINFNVPLLRDGIKRMVNG